MKFGMPSKARVTAEVTSVQNWIMGVLSLVVTVLIAFGFDLSAICGGAALDAASTLTGATE